MILQDLGRAEETVPLLLRATEVDEEFPDPLANLARAYRYIGQHDAAVAAARRATELDPAFGEAWLQFGFGLLSLGQNAEAVRALNSAATLLPGMVGLHAAIAKAAMAIADYPSAARALREILRVQPDSTDALVNLGAVLIELNQLDEAGELLRRAVDQAPESIVACKALARVLHQRFEAPELVSICRRILTAEPGNLDMLALLASGFIWLGRFDELAAECDAMLARHPENRWFVEQLGAVIPRLMDDSEIALCRSQLTDQTLPNLQRVTAGYALGKALDRAGQFDEAFDAFRTANGLLHRADRAANSGFDHAELSAYVDNTCRIFSPAVFSGLRPLGNDSEVPVFVVGMMRTGTTLVEQIAASHPRVFGAGENPEILGAVRRLNQGPIFVSPDLWIPEQLRQEANDLVVRMMEKGRGAERVIDKLPANIQLLGQIRVLFPKARIILCRRDLRDVCFSCFTTHFGESIPWAHDLAECAGRTVEIERLTRHWLSVLPGPLLEVRYENLVANLEAESRRLVDFLGLDWDPACISFQRTERIVTTASAWQVRQPIYDSSVGRWRRYEAHLGPMLEGLAGYVPAEPGREMSP